MSAYTDTLTKLRNEQEKIASGWNGKEEKYIVEGNIYTEDNCILACNIIDKINGLLDLLREVK